MEGKIMAVYTVRVTTPTADPADPWHEEIQVQGMGSHDACTEAKRVIRKRFGVTRVQAYVISADYGS